MKSARVFSASHFVEDTPVFPVVGVWLSAEGCVFRVVRVAAYGGVDGSQGSHASAAREHRPPEFSYCPHF
jgi:hypothetical protein